MRFSEYLNLCRLFRREIADVKRDPQGRHQHHSLSPMQKRKAVDLMALAKSMGDFRSSMAVVGCSHESLRSWRGLCA